MRRLAIPLAGLLVLFGGGSAHASITIGQLAPNSASIQTCFVSAGALAQPTVTSGRPYVAPATGRIISWSNLAPLGSGTQRLTLDVYRPLGGNDYLVLSQDGPRDLTPGAVNTFAADLAVKPGDVIGLDPFPTDELTGCWFSAPGDTYWTSFPDHPEQGESATFSPGDDSRLNVTAEFEPSSAFSLGNTTRNKKKGKATITVNLSGPGSVAVSGKGLKAQQASLATPTGGDVSVAVVAKGKVAKKLRKRGKATVSPTVTFTPTGGASATQSESVKLVKKR
jgi:hypothetical protein